MQETAWITRAELVAKSPIAGSKRTGPAKADAIACAERMLADADISKPCDVRAEASWSRHAVNLLKAELSSVTKDALSAERAAVVLVDEQPRGPSEARTFVKALEKANDRDIARMLALACSAPALAA